MNPYLIVFGFGCLLATAHYASQLNPMGFASGIAAFLLFAAAWVGRGDS